MDAVAPIPSEQASLVLTKRDIARLMSPDDWLDAVEIGFRAYAEDRAQVPLPMHISAPDGAFHAKGARLMLERSFVAVKLNGNFPSNPERHARPTIQGVLILCDACDGRVLAVIDSAELTLRRTAGASALAARLLALPGVDCIAICGCGAQGRAHLAALASMISPGHVRAWDRDATKAKQFAREMAEALHLDVIAVPDAASATRSSKVIVTATTARQPFLSQDMVPPGAFVAAVGADSPDKSELMPDLMANATIVVDLVAQAAVMGDLHHAVEAGVVTVAGVHAELADLVVGRKAGRTHADEVIIFDSTGTALQDAASAVRIYERALARNIGARITFDA